MKAFQRSWRRAHRGFTLVELLTVIGLIILIAALAVPNFTAMMREQRWNSAVSTLQAAIMRARTYANSENLDHAVEICTDTDPEQTVYLRIEAESAFLEGMPNLREYILVTDSFMMMPTTWSATFLARRDAWGSDGRRLYSGIIDVNWDQATNYGTGWGHLAQNHYYNTSLAYYRMRTMSRFAYDRRYKSRYGYGKEDLPWPWQYPADNESRALSCDERSNFAGDHGYQDVNDSMPYVVSSATNTEIVWHIQDNLAVDDFLYLPYDIKIDLNHADSTLINFDADVVSGRDIANHGWDKTRDIRFGKDGHLIQIGTPVIVLTRKDGQVVRLRLLRGTGRLERVL